MPSVPEGGRVSGNWDLSERLGTFYLSKTHPVKFAEEWRAPSAKMGRLLYHSNGGLGRGAFASTEALQSMIHIVFHIPNLYGSVSRRKAG